MVRYGCIPGARIEEVGSLWAAYSPASGQTHLLNDESAVLLGWLQAHGPADVPAAAIGLAAELELSPDEVATRLDLGWAPLIEAGLVRRIDGDPVAAA